MKVKTKSNFDKRSGPAIKAINQISLNMPFENNCSQLRATKWWKQLSNLFRRKTCPKLSHD